MTKVNFRRFVSNVITRLRLGGRGRRRGRPWSEVELLESRQLLSVVVEQNTVLVKNIDPDISSFPRTLTNVNGTLFLTANTYSEGRELWKSNGTPAGTTRVKNIASGSSSGSPQHLTNVNGILFFSAYSGDSGRELWKSDGTEAGTVLVRDIASGVSSSDPALLINVNGTLFFTANNGSTGTELWKSDGTSSGTVLVKDILPSGSSYPTSLCNVNGVLFFAAADGSVPGGSNRELWRSDGTSSGTSKVKEISQFFGSQPSFLTNVNGTLFFSADNTALGTELWRSDGTASGTMLVRDMNFFYSSYPSHLTNVNGILFFTADNSDDPDFPTRQLWKSDGTSAGTEMVRNINPYGSDPAWLTNVNGTVFFAANNNTNGMELWKSNGTSSGTVLVNDIRVGFQDSNPNQLTNVNGTLYFAANNNTNGLELWRSDGTSSGTVMVNDIKAGPDSSYPYYLTNVNGQLFFMASDLSNDLELWRTNVAPTGLSLSATSIAENQPAGTSVGTLASTDGDLADTFTYALVSGTGATDNGSFTIDGNTLKANASLNFEAKSTYYVRVRTTDMGALSYEQQFTITVTNVNETPTNITLSGTSIAENQPSGSFIGNFSTTDPDAGNTFTYTLVNSASYPDNNSFTIGGTSGSSLLTAASFDFETKSSYSILVRSTDQGGLFFEKQFTITVTNVNDSPTNLTLSPSSIAENQPSGSFVGNFSTTDQDAGNTFTYTLVDSASYPDNNSFTIGGTSGGSLLTAASFDFETKSNYTIRVRSTDQGGLSFEKDVTITVTDVNESPVTFTLSPMSVAENRPIGTVVGSFSTTDPDTGDMFTYAFASGPTGVDNDSFSIDGGTLKTNSSFDFETKTDYTIRVRSTDAGGLWREKTFTITVTNVNETPTGLTLSATSIPENQPIGTNIGTFGTTDPDAGNTFTYTLVDSASYPDNNSFTIGGTSGSSLLTAASFDFETKSSYTILVRSTDQGGLWVEQQYTITVTDGNDVPSNLALSNVVSVLLANTNTTSAIRLADVVVTDDGLGTNTLSLSGVDASIFEIVAGQLRLKAGTVLNYATHKSYSVTVNVDDTSLGNTPDVSVNYTLNLQGLEGTTVQNGAAGRSYVRYASLNFSGTLALAEAVATVGTANSRIRLFFGGTSGTQAVARTLTAGMVSLVGNQVKIDFGANGVGGDRNSSLGDGIYRVRVDLDGDGTAEITGTFFRLFGDVDGNGVVNDTDISLVTAAQGQSGLLAADLNGDGVVDAFDLTNVKRRKGARVTL